MKKGLLDMDNVLVDFVTGSLRAHRVAKTVDELWANNLGEWNYHTHPDMLGMTSDIFYAPMDQRYWADLSWMHDGKEILALMEMRFGRENVVLVTTPSSNRGCHEGKLEWMRRNLPAHYSSPRGHVFASAKWLMSNSNHLLVDDSDDNCERFAEYNGGQVCLVPRHWNKLHGERDRAARYVAEQLGF